MALCEDESCGLARMTSDDRIVRGFGVPGKGSELRSPAPPRIPAANRDQQGGTCGESRSGGR